ncbi:MAG: redoxin domain-containing protein [Flavobacteriales bacterium]|nr:redoxin domain-containing protein [Flavobacteriales bacterium]
MRIVPVLFALMLGSGLAAAPVSVRVEAPTYAGKHIRLFAYSDLFTLRTVLLAEAELDAQGNAMLSADVMGTRKAIFRVGPVGADLYLRAGTYHVRIPPPASGEALPLGGTIRVDLEFIDLPALDVNALVSDLNERLDAFVAEQLATDNNAGMNEVAKVRAGKVKPTADSARAPAQIFTGPQWAPARTDTFAQKLRKFYADVHDTWFQSDVEYGLAGLYLGPRNDDRKLFERYLKDKPVLYDVPEYVRFFNGFYEGYMMRFGYAKAPDSFAAFLRSANTDSLKTMLARNDFLRAPEVNELVLINGLYAEHGNKQLDPRGVLAVLQYVQAHSVFPENRTLAANMVADLTAMQPGQPLPSLRLRTVDGTAEDLSALPAGPVCIFITTPRCTYCEQELAALGQQVKEYGEYVQFVGILAKGENTDMSAWLAEHPDAMGLTWYSPTRTDELLEELRLVSVPAVYLVTDNILLASPGPLPSQGLTNVLFSIKAKADEERRIKPDRGMPPPKR